MRLNSKLVRATSLGLMFGGVLVLSPLLGGCASKGKPFKDVAHRGHAPPPNTGGFAEASPSTMPSTVATVDAVGGTGAVRAPDVIVVETQPVAHPATRPVIVESGAMTVPSETKTTPSGELSSARQVRVEEGGALIRYWPETLVLRPSGDTLAGPNYWPSLDKALQRKDLDNLYMEPAEFWINLFLMPVRAVMTPPWTPMVYSPVGPTGHGPAGKE
jgi:hypothetical protein